MEKNLEIEKKYLLEESVGKETAINFLMEQLCLTPAPNPLIINHDTYYDENNLLSNLGLNARQRKVGEQTEYTLKIKVDAKSIDKRKELNFSSLEEMVKFIKNNLNLPINNLTETLKLVTKRHLYYYRFINTLIEVSLDEVSIYFNNVSLKPFYMIECEFKKGNVQELEYLNNAIIKMPFLKPCNLSKKDIALTRINTTPNLIRKRNKNLS